MGFWEGERCEYCHGAIEEKLIEETASGRRKAEEEIHLPVYSFAGPF